ncbi:MAG: YkgJ family cysteine cluster protein [Chitinispirillaceae bacterium]|nr:YkgJ family cysteine cluster protein [Chitinispirillaceae bacterium]
MTASEPKPLTVPDSARHIENEICHALRVLVAGRDNTCLSNRFLAQWGRITDLAGSYQQEIIAAYQRKPSCAAGCDVCCCHWVEDVSSFEAAIIAAQVRERMPDEVLRIIRQCREDLSVFSRLEALADQKLSRRKKALIDKTDLLCGAFYQMQRPCPLLLHGRCSIYAVRPLTCRMFVNFAAPARCNPDADLDEQISNYLFGLGDEAAKLIEILHQRFHRSPETALRPQLLGLLTESL